MAITVNDGGVLRTLGAVSVNGGGVIKTLGSVSANDGGIIRGVFSSKKVKVEGITPLVLAEDHMVIVSPGSFTLTAPAGARIILGSGGADIKGGYVAEYTLSAGVRNAQCTAAVAGEWRRAKDATKLVVAGTAYGCGSTIQIIQSKWGPIGGRGGDGGHDRYAGADGTGAGGGGGAYSLVGDPAYNPGKGGNSGGYGNYGGDGGNINHRNGYDGASGKGGALDGSTCGGGGGGYAAGGGGGGWADDDNEYADSAESGSAGAGIIVIEWDN